MAYVHFACPPLHLLDSMNASESFPGDSAVKNPPANVGDVGSIPGSGGPPEGGKGDPLQDSCLGNPMDREPGGLQSMGSRRVGCDLGTKQYC